MLHDVSGMLDRMRPAELDELEAYDNVHGVGLTRLMEIVTNGFVRLILAWSSDKNPDVDGLRKAIDPWLQRESS